MKPLVLGFEAVGERDLAIVGGKGANLGEMARAALPIPGGFCVTTHAYRALLDGDESFEQLLAELEQVEAADIEAARTTGKALRAHISAQTMPAAVADAIVDAWQASGSEHAYAVRSSATAEDLPHASFAGQQDTYLNIVGRDALLEAVRDCWASLFTDRAILYRLEQGIAHRDVALCVVIQRMVAADKAGILFTADPLSGKRHVATIDAGWGLGESLVSGRVSADLYVVDRRERRVIDVRIGDKSMAIYGLVGGGTEEVALDAGSRKARVLSDEEALQVTAMGERIEALRGGPQDVEWCFDAGELFVVQSRPITSLFPLVTPRPDDDTLRTYFCVNHFQVMTDAMPPMAVHVWKLALPLGKPIGGGGESPWVGEAGSRIYVDVSKALRVKPMRTVLLRALESIDMLAKEATPRAE